MVFRGSQRACVLCGVRLEPVHTASHRYERCPACFGLWIEPAVVQGMFAGMGAGVEPRYQAARTHERPRACAACGAEMLKSTLEGILVDVCTPHGVWFDKDELGHALERAATGEWQPPGRPDAFASLLRQLYSG